MLKIRPPTVRKHVAYAEKQKKNINSPDKVLVLLEMSHRLKQFFPKVKASDTSITMSTKWKKLAKAGGIEITDNIDAEDLHNFSSLEPELFIKFVRIPSLKTYASLNGKLRNCSKEWLTEFLELGGLTSLFEVLGKLSDRGLAKFSDAFLQLECVRCIKVVMNNVTGLDFMSKDPSLTRQLVTGKSFSSLNPELFYINTLQLLSKK